MHGAEISYPTPNASLPDASFAWLDHSGAVIDLSTYTAFTVKIARRNGATPVVTKSTGIAGFATTPNLVVSWADGELSDLTSGNWQMEVEATDASGKTRVLRTVLVIENQAL